MLKIENLNCYYMCSENAQRNVTSITAKPFLLVFKTLYKLTLFCPNDVSMRYRCSCRYMDQAKWAKMGENYRWRGESGKYIKVELPDQAFFVSLWVLIRVILSSRYIFENKMRSLASLEMLEFAIYCWDRGKLLRLKPILKYLLLIPNY